MLAIPAGGLLRIPREAAANTLLPQVECVICSQSVTPSEVNPVGLVCLVQRSTLLADHNQNGDSQFACFTGAIVQALTQLLRSARGVFGVARRPCTHFTCCTSTHHKY